MEIFKEFVAQYGTTILYAALTAIAGYIGIAIKRLYEKICNDKTKRSIVRTCVRAVEQLYVDLHGEEKYDKCVEACVEMLAEKGIQITEIELKMLIEAAVKEFNIAFEQPEYLEIYTADADGTKEE